MPEKSVNELLLDAIRERGNNKQAEHNSGILTADRYVRTLDECVGHELCYRYAASKSASWDDILKKSTSSLTYNNPDMKVEDLYGTNFKWQDADGDELALPKHTLMVFKHVLTTPRKDRDGDIMRTGGAVPDRKMALLWQHVHTLPIGRLLSVDTHNEKTLTVVSAIVDINDLAHDSAVMIEAGMGRFSHGFKALEFEKNKDGGGFDVKRFEILEESLVSVPSNVDAESQEIMLSLVEGGKLTNPICKEIGVGIRSKKNKSVAVGIDVANLKTGEHDGNKSEGKPGCTCGGKPGASEETDDDESDARAKANADGKEVMLCKCGGKMVNGVCEKCGAHMEGKATVLTIKEAGMPTGEKMSGAYVYVGQIDGSFEAIGWGLRSIAKRLLVDAGIVSEDNPEKGVYQYVDVVGTFSDYAILSASTKDGYAYYKAGWQMKDGMPSFTGAPIPVKIATNTTIVEKSIQGNREWLEIKAGRAISAKNMQALTAAHDNIKEVTDKELLLSKGGRALCKEAMGGIKSVIGEMGEASTDTVEVKTIADEILAAEAFSVFLANASELQLQKMKRAVASLEQTEQVRRETATLQGLLN